MAAARRHTVCIGSSDAHMDVFWGWTWGGWRVFYVGEGFASGDFERKMVGIGLAEVLCFIFYWGLLLGEG